MSMEFRDKHLDMLRGLAIILVVFGHSTGGSNDFLNKIVLSFHMPLFFFISGMVYHKIKKSNISGYILPHCLVILFQIILDILFILITKQKNLNYNIVDWLFGGWFLPVLFICRLLLSIVNINMRNEDNVWHKFVFWGIFVILILISLVSIHLELYRYIRYFAIVPTALLFYYGGFVFSLHKSNRFIATILSNRFYKTWFVICLISFFPYLVMQNETVLMYKNIYGNYFIFLVNAIIGIALCWEISGTIKNNLFLEWCGKNSIYIYVFQFTVTRIVRIIMIKVSSLNSLLFIDNIIIDLLCFAISLSVLIPVTIIFSRYFYYLFGRKKSS